MPLSTDKRDFKRLFLAKMETLRRDVACLRDLYAEHPWLNDEYDVSRLIPMSLDEWEVELAAFIAQNQT